MTCKVFFDAGRSAVVYKHAMAWSIPWVSFLRYPDRAKRRFVDRCVDAGNPDAILRDRLHEYFFYGLTSRRNGSTYQGCIAEQHGGRLHGDDVRRGVDLFAVILAAENVHMCREIFTDILAERWVGVTPPDPGQPMACRSPMCPIRGIMGDAHDVSGVSCIRCLADHEFREFLAMFRRR
ncbi:hypothetical protein Ahy_B10g101860 [Arachis hypogaea]|uniref:Uncharacterized protein n=1 Tax=Arachis hypogaea TaxID=3818 RepID=A0A444X0J7_ARAHY|nr:hypothetical protein Ahy_B10g101860 [Arachis hypogaea]